MSGRWLVLVFFVAACGNKSAPPLATTLTTTTTVPGQQAKSPVMKESLLRDLSILTTQAEPTAELKALGARNDVAGVVEMLLADHRFTNVVVGTMLLEDYRFPSYFAPNGMFVLKQEDPSQPYYLRKPCKPADTVSVEPWWALGTQIKVCADAYVPDKVVLAPQPGRATQRPPLCGSWRTPQPGCGCGHNLIHCTHNKAQRRAIRTSIANEVFDTIGYVVSSGEPLQAIYTTNATFRDRNAEVMYRMHDAAAGKPWREGFERYEKASWQPRSEGFPGMHAGILTTTDLSRFTDVPRSEMMAYFSLMTCSTSDGAHVSAHEALGVDTASIRQESGGKDYLAHQVGCTNCHARMENAIGFFAAWRSVFHSVEIEPELQVIKEGHVYLNDIDDLRGTVQTTPAAFAGVVTAQPEFASCQAGRIANYLFNGAPQEPSLAGDLAAMIMANKPARDVLKVALTRYIQRMSERVEATDALESSVDSTYSVPFQAEAVRTFDAGLVAALSVCEDCHGGEKKWIDQAVKTHKTTALHMLRMADMVASRSMPKKVALSDADREGLVTKLCQTAWADSKLGNETAAVLLGHRRPSSVHEFGTVVHLFEGMVPNNSDQPWKVPELMMKPGSNFLTPGTAATYGLEALRVCHERSKAPSDIDACMDQLLDDGAFMRTGPVGN